MSTAPEPPDAVQQSRRRSHRRSAGQGDLGERGWLRSVERLGHGVRLTGPVLVRGRGTVVIGDDVVLDAAAAPIELLAAPGGRLEIGAGARIGPGASLEAGTLVKIGPGAVVGPYAKVLDNNHHGTRDDRHGRPESTPIVVGAGARVGSRSTLLPGAWLGEGSVLGDDSVLSGRVPANVMVAGAPARLVRKVAPGESAPPPSWARGEEPAAVAPFRTLNQQCATTGPAMMRWLDAFERLGRLSGPKAGHRALSKAENLLARCNGRAQLRTATLVGRVYVHGALDLRTQGRLEIGDSCSFAGGPVRSRLEVGPGAELRIGGGAVINYGVLIRAEEGIRIGDGLLMGSRTLILDRHEEAAGPITIGDDVWLAHGVTVLPGVTIGDGSAVSAGTVVDRDVPPGCLAVGSPLKFRALAALVK